MPLLQWKPQYSVGVEAVDHEHRELIDLINTLYDQLTEGQSKVKVEAFFGDLFKGISAHFALEERFMSERRYDQLTEHKSDHERLLDQIRDIMDEFTNEAVLDTGELAVRLEAWFARHFETHDARLHKALGAHPH
jgi:hemerythrin